MRHEQNNHNHEYKMKNKSQTKKDCTESLSLKIEFRMRY